MADTIRILSIDGGGIRGIIPTMVLQALLGATKAQDAFHIIAGTSTGGIIASGLSKPNPLGLDQILKLYVDHGSGIFDKGSENLFHSIAGPRYKPDELESQLQAELGDTYLSEVKDTELLVPSYAIGLPEPDAYGNTAAPLFFRSWQARGVLPGGKAADRYDFKLADIARATSAAPTYFPPAANSQQGRPVIYDDRWRSICKQSDDFRISGGLPPVPFDGIPDCLAWDRKRARSNRRQCRGRLGRYRLGKPDHHNSHGRQRPNRRIRGPRNLRRPAIHPAGHIACDADAAGGNRGPVNGQRLTRKCEGVAGQS